MIPQEHLGTAQVPGQDGELRLYRHDKDFMFRVRGAELMTSRAHGSEELLAELALARLPDTGAARILVGGLGMGFTLAKTLSLVGEKAVVDVVELVVGGATGRLRADPARMVSSRMSISAQSSRTSCPTPRKCTKCVPLRRCMARTSALLKPWASGWDGSRRISLTAHCSFRLHMPL